MAHDISQLFESRHIEKYLGINKNQLFHWVETKRLVKPAIKGTGRGGRNRFSFINLLELNFIKQLSELGLELNAIKAILKGKRVEYFGDERKGIETWKRYLAPGFTPWEIFKKDRKKLEKEGLWLEIYKERKINKWEWWYRGGKESLIMVEGFLRIPEKYAPVAKIIISISRLILELEEKTGRTL